MGVTRLGTGVTRNKTMWKYKVLIGWGTRIRT
jgi:hypothetical protein